MAERIIFHVDANSAFLSWTAAYRVKVLGEKEDLRDIPSVVAGDKESRHSIILARSTPAKKYGIQTGEPLFQALQKCPDLKVVPPDYALYVEASRHFVEMLRQFSPKVEQYSIDEAWGDMTGTERLFGPPVMAADVMRRRIWEELGFTVNVGISTNKLLAKMAGDFEKPNKVHTLFPKEMESKMWPLPVRDLFLVGAATENKLKKMGIYTIGDLANAEISVLRKKLGKHGETIWHFANGLDDSRVAHKDFYEAPKSIGHGVTCVENLDNYDEANKVIVSLCQDIGYKLRKQHLSASGVALTVKDKNLVCQSYQAKLSSPTQDELTISKTAYELLIKNYTFLSLN